MGKSIKHLLSSYKTSILLLLIYAFMLAIATVIEKYGGTPAAKAFIYYSPLLFFVYALIIANFFAVVWRNKLLQSRKWGFLFVHFSFIVILAGALVTHVFGEEGTIHLREGQTTDRMIVQSGRHGEVHSLPFRLELVEFTLERYPGSASPSSYESKIIVHTDREKKEEIISMNNVLDIKGYRLFQASYDKDEQGSIISVNKDVVGRSITYTGYLLLAIGLILCFTGKNTRFRRLARQLKEIKNAAGVFCFAVLFCFSFSNVNAHSAPDDLFKVIQGMQIDKDHAADFGALPILPNKGRIEPINTFSSEILRKLHKSNRIGKLNSDQFLLSVLCLPEMWMNLPFISYSNKDIAFNHDLREGECSYNEMFDSNGNYKLTGDLENAFSKPPSTRTGYEKDLIKLDEQINIFHQLLSGNLIAIPGTYKESLIDALKTGNWHEADNQLKLFFESRREGPLLHTDDVKLKAEIIYNKVNIFAKCKNLYFALGATLLLFAVVSLFNDTKRLHWLAKVMVIHLWVVLVLQFAGIAVRWYIAGYAPWSNSYETMVLLSFLTVLSGMFLSRTNRIPLALAAIFAGVILFVSGLNWMNPQITPLVPVLKSPWLMFHVAIVMIAYGFFGISFLLGITNMVLLRIRKQNKAIAVRIHELTIMNEMSLLAGLAFMTAGVFIGAVWANESWGRYWGWDPKETWALITIIVYAAVTHLRLVKKWSNPFRFNLLSVIAFACVLMTYFGVNYLLSGMHSYN